MDEVNSINDRIYGDRSPPISDLHKKAAAPADVVNIGSSKFERQKDDWYPEPSWCVELLADAEQFAAHIWDPCCGGGTIPKVFEARGHKVLGTDLVWRGYGPKANGGVIHNFLSIPKGTTRASGDIVMNPPYKLLSQFIDKALTLKPGKVAVLTRLSFLGSEVRHDWFVDLPVQRVWVLSNRPSMPPGDVAVEAKGGMADYCWIVLKPGWNKEPRLNWLARAPS